RDQRVASSHAAYLALLQECATATQEPAVAAVAGFLSARPLDHLRLPDKFDVGGTIAFRVAGQFVTDLPTVKRFWASYALGDKAEAETGDVMPCLICGQMRPALTSLPGNIKGLPGGQSSGMALISANAK